MTPSRHSIQLKLTLSVTSLVAALGAIFAFSAYAWFRANLEADLESFAHHEAEELANAVASSRDADELRERRAALEGLLAEEGVLALEVWSLAGEWVYGLPQPVPSAPVPWLEGLDSARAGRRAFANVQLQGRPEGLRTAVLARFEGKPRWLVTATVSRERSVAALTRFGGYGAVAALSATLLVFFGSFALLSRALRPVQELVVEAVALSREGAGRRLAEPPDGSELADLASLLNQLLDQTEETLTRLRRFTADAGHELRTPLAHMRGEVELALSGDLATARRALESVLEELDSLRRVIDGLLDLARGDEPVLGDEPPLDLAELLVEVVGEADMVGREQGVHLELLEAPPATVRGSRALLARLLWNLIDNAIRVSAPAGTVQLRLLDLGDGCVAIDVEDDGPGLPGGDPEALFEPFVRGSERPGQPRGYGLGLALSRAIARRHAGELAWLKPSKLAGARIRLVLPVAPRDPWEH